MYMYMVQYDVQTMTVHMKHAKIKKKKIRYFCSHNHLSLKCKLPFQISLFSFKYILNKVKNYDATALTRDTYAHPWKKNNFK